MGSASENQNRSGSIIVVGGIATDFVIRGWRLPLAGQAVEGRKFREYPGGKSANQALAAARLGAQVTLIGKVGSDARGAEAIRELERGQVDTRFIVHDSDEPTGATLSMRDKDGNCQTQHAPGANRRLRPSEVRKAAALFKRASVVLVSLEIPLATVLAAVGLAVGCGAQVVLDPAPAPDFPIPDTLLRLVDLVMPNAREARALTGLEVTDRDGARGAGERLLWRGSAAAVVGAPEGRLLLWAERENWLPHLEVNAVDPSGAGDALAAGIALSLSEGHDLRNAVLFGGAAAASATTRPGVRPSFPDRDEVLALLGKFAPRFEAEFRFPPAA